MTERYPTETRTNPETLNNILSRMAIEPANRRIMYEILVYCQEPRSIEAISAHVTAVTAGSAVLHPHETYVAWLISMEAVERTDHPKRGAQFTTTSEGKAVVELANPDHRLSALFNNQGEHKQRFIQILQACVEPKSRADIEQMLDGVLETTGFYPSYFVSELEDAGGLIWKSGWTTTDSGMALLMAELLIEE